MMVALYKTQTLLASVKNTMNNPFKHLFHPTAVDFLAFVRCCHDYLRLGCLFSLVKTHFMYHQGVKKMFCKAAFI